MANLRHDWGTHEDLSCTDCGKIFIDGLDGARHNKPCPVCHPPYIALGREGYEPNEPCEGCLYSPDTCPLCSKPTRPSLDQTFMEIADVVARRATCSRKYVGAVIVLEGHIVSTGYNGAPSGLPHCDQAGHELSVIDGNEACIRATHAEVNAVTVAAKYGRGPIAGGTMYITHAPCLGCAKTIITAGLVRVVFGQITNGPGISLCLEAGLKTTWYNG